MSKPIQNVGNFSVLHQQNSKKRTNIFYKVISVQDYDAWKIFVLSSIFINYIFTTYTYYFLRNPINIYSYYIILGFDVVYGLDFILTIIIFFWKKVQLQIKKPARSKIYVLFNSILVLPYSFFYELITRNNQSDTFLCLRSILFFRLFHLIIFFYEKSNSAAINRWKYFVIKYFLYTFILHHTVACIWYLLAIPISSDGKRRGWAKEISYNSPWEWYIVCIYFTMLNCTGCGFGNLLPVTITEKIVSTFTMCLGFILINGVLISNLSSLYINGFKRRATLRNQLNEIKKHLKIIRISHEVRKTILGYYNILWHQKKGVKEAVDMELLPFPLRTEVSFDINIRLLHCSAIFKNTPESFLRNISYLMKYEFLQPGEIIYHQNVIKNKMVCVASGVIEVLSEEDSESPMVLFGQDSCIGETALILSLPSKAVVRAATYTDLQVLYKKDFITVIELYPDLYTNIRELILDGIDYAVYNYHTDQVKETELSLYVAQQNESAIKRLKTGALRYLGYNLVKTPIKKTDNSRSLCLTTNFPWILQPNSSLSRTWEFIVTFNAFFIAIFYPYYIAFTRTFPSWLQILSIFIELINVIDIYVILTTAIIEKTEIIKTFKGILLKRMNTFGFYLDIISACYLEGFAYLSSDSDRLYYVLKLNRLFKIYRVFKLFRKIENKLTSPVFTLRLLKYPMLLTIFPFWFGCLLYLETCYSVICEETGWFYEKLTENSSRKLKNPCTQYETKISIYFALSAMSGLGYGDILAKNIIDTILVYFGVIIGLLVFGYCTAELVATVIYKTKSKIEFQESFFPVIKFMKDKKITKATRERVVNFLALQWYYDKGVGLSPDGTLFYNANSKLQEDILINTRLQRFMEMPIFKFANKNFIHLMVTQAKTLILPPNEIITSFGDYIRKFYIIQDGYCMQYIDDDTFVVGPNSNFLFTNIMTNLPCLITIKTITYVKLIVISDELFKSTLSLLPAVNKEFYDTLAFYNLEEIKNSFSLMDILKEKPTIIDDNIVGSFLCVPKYCNKIHTKYSTAFHGYITWTKFILPPICILPNGIFLKIWVIFRLMVAIIIALVTPYQQIKTPHVPNLDKFLMVLDIITYVDLYLMFFVGYYGEENQLIVHPLKTAGHYLKGTFLFDFVICFPWVLIIKLLFPPEHSKTYNLLSQDDFHVFLCLLQMVKVFQIYRLLTAFTYLRNDIKRKGDIIELWKIVPFAIIIINICATVIMITSCKYYSKFDLDFSMISGTIAQPPGMAAHESEDYTLFCKKDSWIDRSKYRNYTQPIDVYIVAIYWCTSTLTGCGFGDVTPQHVELLIITIFMIIFGLLFLGYIYASISSHKAASYSFLLKNQERVKELKRFMMKEKVTIEMQHQIIDYLEYRWKRVNGSKINKILFNLPTSLHGDVVFDMYEKVLREVPLFDGIPRSFFRVICQQLHERYYRRRDIIFRTQDVIDKIFIVYRGKVDVISSYNEVQGYICIGGIFGNITPKRKRKMSVTVTAVSNVDVLYMSTESFYTILKKYSAVKAKLDSTLSLHYDFIIPFKNIDDDEENDSKILSYGSSINTQYGKERQATLVSGSRTTIGTHSTIFGFYGNLIGFTLFLLPHKWFKVAILPRAFVFCAFNLLSMIAAYVNCLLATYQFTFQHHTTCLLAITISIDVFFLKKIFLDMHKAFENNYGDYNINNRDILKRYFKNKKRRCYDILANFPVHYFAFVLPFFSIQNHYFYYFSLRMISLLRFIYVLDFYNERSNKLMVNKLCLKISSIFLWLFLSVHIFACIWYLLACPLTYCFQKSWATTAIDKSKYSQDEVYMLCIYFIVTVFTSTGTGDILPDNQMEILYVVFIMIATKFLTGVFIGDALCVLSSYTSSLDNYDYGIIELKDHLENQNISKYQMKRIWYYVKQLWTKSRGKQIPYIISKLRYTNRCDLLSQIYSHHLRDSYLFSDIDESFIRQLCGYFKPAMFFPGNYIVQSGDSDQSMHFIHRGEVDILTIHSNLTETMHEVLQAGEMFGITQGLLKGVQHRFTFRARSRVEIISLKLSDWEDLLNFFPEIKALIYQRAKELYNTF